MNFDGLLYKKLQHSPYNIINSMPSFSCIEEQKYFFLPRVQYLAFNRN